MRSPLVGVSMCACALMLMPTLVPAATIDDFSVALGGWPVTQDTIGGGTLQEFVGAPVLGGVRGVGISATGLDALGVDSVQVSVNPSAGFFDYASSAGADGVTSLHYDDAGAGLGVDVSADTYIQIDFLQFDLANGIAMPVTITLVDSISTVATQTKMLDASGAQAMMFEFSGFSNTGLLDWTDIASIDIGLDPGLATDFRISEVRTDLPEPATLALVVLGAAAFARRRR